MRRQTNRPRRRRGLRAIVALTVLAGLLAIPFLPPLRRYLRIERM